MKPPPETATDDDKELQHMMLEAQADYPPQAQTRAAMHARLMARASESLARHAGLSVVRILEGVWQDAKAGIRFKLLWQGAEGASVLIRFAAGATLPVHRHSHVEEGLVIEGGLQLAELDLGPGDYHISPQGSRHGRISSRQGALAFLRGTSLGGSGGMLGELLGGLLPHAGGEPRTVARDAGEWRMLTAGAAAKLLNREGAWRSCLLRLEPGARLPWGAPASSEECVVISGEAFLGDTLLGQSEYQVATDRTRFGEISTDTGALLFLRGDGNNLA